MGRPDLHPGEAGWKDALQSYAPTAQEEHWENMQRRLDQVPPSSPVSLPPLLLGIGLGVVIIMLYLLTVQSSENTIASPEIQSLPPSEIHTEVAPIIAEPEEIAAPIPIPAFAPESRTRRLAQVGAKAPVRLAAVETPAPATPRVAPAIANFSELSEEQYTPGLMSVSRIKNKIRPVKYEGWILPYPPPARMPVD